MVDIVTGVLKGALEAEGFDDIEKCIADAKHVIDDAEAAYDDFKGHDITQIINGVKEVADLLTSVKDGMQDCSHLKADWAKMAEMASIFESPTEFAYNVGKNLIINGKDIFKEVKTAIDDYKVQDWKNFGVNIGMAAAKTIVGDEEEAVTVPATMGSQELAQVYQGLMESFGAHIDIFALLICIREED
jgi:hypothetical protein